MTGHHLCRANATNSLGALGSGQDVADLGTAAVNALALNGGTIKEGLATTRC